MYQKINDSIGSKRSYNSNNNESNIASNCSNNVNELKTYRSFSWVMIHPEK